MTAIAAPEGIKLIVNGGQLHTTVSLSRAICLIVAEKAEIVEYEDDVFIRSAGGDVEFPMPRVLRLIRFVKLHFEKIYGAPQVSKKGVLTRDNHICSYCGGPHANTVDHVHPQSKGGKSTWLNLVAACKECNNRKRDRTPEEAGMKLRVTPYEPKRRGYAFNQVPVS